MPTEFINRFAETVPTSELTALDVNVDYLGTQSPSFVRNVRRTTGYRNERTRVLDADIAGHSRARAEVNLLTDARYAREASRALALETLPQLRALDSMGVFEQGIEAMETIVEEIEEVNLVEELKELLVDEELREQFGSEAASLMDDAYDSFSAVDTDVVLSKTDDDLQMAIGDESFPVQFVGPDGIATGESGDVVARCQFAKTVRHVEDQISNTGGALLTTPTWTSTVERATSIDEPVHICPQIGLLTAVVDSVKQYETEVRELEDVGLPAESGRVFGAIADAVVDGFNAVASEVGSFLETTAGKIVLLWVGLGAIATGIIIALLGAPTIGLTVGASGAVLFFTSLASLFDDDQTIEIRTGGRYS